MSKWLSRQMAAFAFAACLQLITQECRAGIAGIVTDAQGAVFPIARLEPRNMATKPSIRVRKLTTGALQNCTLNGSALPVAIVQHTKTQHGR